jgi:hypothetical protein
MESKSLESNTDVAGDFGIRLIDYICNSPHRFLNTFEEREKKYN